MRHVFGRSRWLFRRSGGTTHVPSEPAPPSGANYLVDTTTGDYLVDSTSGDKLVETS